MASQLFAVVFDGKGKLKSFSDLGDTVLKSAQLALNDVTRKTRTKSARAVRDQVNLPASYVSDSGGRLSVTGYAKTDSLEARISARKRPTSLARFATSAGRGKSGVRVEVEPGVAHFLRGAFFVNLRQGSTDTKGNQGLAIRLPAGKKPRGAYKPVKLSRGAWLLYGPSVAQALLSARESGIWPDMSEEIAEDLEREFLRQMERLNA